MRLLQTPQHLLKSDDKPRTMGLGALTPFTNSAPVLAGVRLGLGASTPIASHEHVTATIENTATIDRFLMENPVAYDCACRYAPPLDAERYFCSGDEIVTSYRELPLNPIAPAEGDLLQIHLKGIARAMLVVGFASASVKLAIDLIGDNFGSAIGDAVFLFSTGLCIMLMSERGWESRTEARQIDKAESKLVKMAPAALLVAALVYFTGLDGFMRTAIADPSLYHFILTGVAMALSPLGITVSRFFQRLTLESQLNSLQGLSKDETSLAQFFLSEPAALEEFAFEWLPEKLSKPKQELLAKRDQLEAALERLNTLSKEAAAHGRKMNDEGEARTALEASITQINKEQLPAQDALLGKLIAWQKEVRELLDKVHKQRDLVRIENEIEVIRTEAEEALIAGSLPSLEPQTNLNTIKALTLRAQDLVAAEQEIMETFDSYSDEFEESESEAQAINHTRTP